MTEVKTVGLDLAKNVFQAHGADGTGETIFNKKLRRAEVDEFFEKLPPCIVGMEACGSAHHWARVIKAHGHDVRILPAQYVKPFVARGKTDAADAAAINLALTRRDVRPVQVKTAEEQAAMMIIRARALFIRQRTSAILALRGHMAEFGLVAETGLPSFNKLVAAIPAHDDARIPAVARLVFDDIIAEIKSLTTRINRINEEIESRAKADDDIRRLIAIPGVGMMVASTIKARIPDPLKFKSGRHFAAWLGLTPKIDSSGGKVRSGRISKMGNTEIRSLLFMGALSVVSAARKNGTASTWLRKLIDRRPLKVVAVAFANKLARTIWALLAKGGSYRPVISMSVASTL
ncbi:IS110 family RNA-guided transposase [Rhizobium bangladeshense]|uniref:IS110 family transposase n=1 Tax=Rhizobium bangladeshense TaxID=1138189 RepID=UPI001C90907C|nr:IS110 family transposase [Rhizobium bangladeshense]MBY3597585.1 IS110 family transposase [Rhizobium bangladeshense]